METSINDKAIICKNLTKRFGDFKAVDQITFDVDRGEIFGFLDANDAGKTTDMRILSGRSLRLDQEEEMPGIAQSSSEAEGSERWN